MRLRDLLLWLNWVMPLLKYQLQQCIRWTFGRPNADKELPR
jgi:hypothetical protein